MYPKKAPVFAFFIMLVGPACLWAEQVTESVMSPQELQAAKELVETKRDLAVNANLELTAEENKNFWPLYEEYRLQIRETRERKLDLIEAYAAHYRAGSIDDDFADQAVRESIQIQLETARIRQKYWKKFRRVLPATKAAIFYQLENKMDAEVDYVIAGGVPLVEAK